MTQTITRLTLLETMQTGHQHFKALIAALPPDQLLCPGVTGVWSVKDILAHIIVHEQCMVDWVTKTLRGMQVDGPQPYSMPEPELTVLNEQIYQQNRGRRLAEVLSDLDAAYLQALAMVEAAPERDLLDVHRFSLRDGEPLWEAIAANTFWHYEEHSRDIRAWLAR